MPTITPISAPSKVEGALSARERAIAKMTQDATPPPVTSPEDLTAIKASLNRSEQQTGQSPNNESQSSPSDQPQAEASKPESTPTRVEQPLSSQYAQLARKEKAIRAQAQQIKAQEASFKAREDALKAKEVEMMSHYVAKSRLSEDPLTVLSENGLSYDQLTQKLLNVPNPEQFENQRVINELRAEIKSLRDATEGTKKSIEDNQKQQYQQALNQIRNEAVQITSRDPSFETIKATNSVNDVVELIEKTFQKDGVLLTVEEAAQAVEEYLVDEALKIARLSKIQQRLKPAQSTPVKQSQTTPESKQPPKPTLTNAASTSRPLTARERAILAFKNELK